MLQEKAMLVNLSISQWTARKFDREISADVARQHGASAEAGRYNKVLIAVEAVQAYTKISNSARTYHYKATLPWLDTGARILPAAMFNEYSAKMREFRGDWEKAVATFQADYPVLIAEARQRLNGMFRVDDYPDPASIGNKFGWAVGISPLPAAEDFRVSLGAAEVDKIKRQIEARAVQAQQAAMSDLWERLHLVCRAMADKLGQTRADGKAPIFHDSLVGNVQELVDMLPRLNITGDSRLEAARRDVEIRLLAHSAGELRESPEARAQVAGDAQAILDAMVGIYGQAAA